jgi:hypothetical protein
MPAKNTVEVKLTLKDQISKAYSKVRKTVTTENTKTKESLKGVERQAKATQISLGGVVKAAAGFFVFREANRLIRESIQLAGVQQQAEAKVAAAIKSTGGAAGLTADELKKMASGLQKVTTVGDETILRGQAMLLTFTNIGKDVFPQATETMLDMAQAMGTDVKESAIQLGKALNDPIIGATALRRVGVALTDQQTKMIKEFVQGGDLLSAQKVILNELQVEFGGLARAMAETDAGQMAQLNNRLGDIKETLGAELLPVFNDLTKSFVEFLEEGAKTGELQENFRKLANFIRVTGAVFIDATRGWARIMGLAERFNASQEVSRQERAARIAKGRAGEHQALLNLAAAYKRQGAALVDFNASIMSGSALTEAFDKIDKQSRKHVNVERTGALRGGKAAAGRSGGVSGGPSAKDSPEFAQAIALQGEIELALMSGRERELAELENHILNKQAILFAAGADQTNLVELERSQRAGINDKWDTIERDKAKEQADKLLAIKRAEINAQMQLGSQIIGLGKAIFGENKALFVAEQSLAAARVIFNGMVAASAAVAPPPAGLGPIAGLPLAALIRTETVFAVATIMAQTIKGFANGGFINSGSTQGDNTLARVNRGEVVLNTAQQRNFMDMANGGGGNSITFEAPVINVANGNPQVIAQAVTETYQEQIRRFADMQRDARVLQI